MIVKATKMMTYVWVHSHLKNRVPKRRKPSHSRRVPLEVQMMMKAVTVQIGLAILKVTHPVAKKKANIKVSENVS